MSTPRNGLPVPDWRRDVDYIARIDTLYEVADAELNSDKKMHEAWGESSKPRFMYLVRQQLKAINLRDQLRIDSEDRDGICERIYNDWCAAKGKENVDG